MSNVKVEVVHPKFYFAAGGKKKHIPAGSEIEVSQEQLVKLRKKVRPLSERKKVKVDAAPSKAAATK